MRSLGDALRDNFDTSYKGWKLRYAFMLPRGSYRISILPIRDGNEAILKGRFFIGLISILPIRDGNGVGERLRLEDDKFRYFL